MDFLHYITESNDTGLRENSDHRLKDLHHKIQQIKASDEMEASFMKAEERERLIREKGREEGRVETLIYAIQQIVGKTGRSAEEAMDMLDISAEDREEYKKLLVEKKESAN